MNNEKTFMVCNDKVYIYNDKNDHICTLTKEELQLINNLVSTDEIRKLFGE